MSTNSRIQTLQQALDNANSYAEWVEIGNELDALTGMSAWKEEEATDLYDYSMIRDRLASLRDHVRKNDMAHLTRELREGLYHDLGNMGNPLLYCHAHVGTKKLVEEYVEAVCSCLELVCDAEIEGLTWQKKLRYFQEIAQSYGQPALMLSGGATLGLFHIGVCKALHEQGLLPQVISGSSAGSLMAAMIGTHTDAELQNLYSGDGFYMHAWSWNGLLKGLRGEGFADQRQLEQFARRNIGEYTFEEAYARTGRHINVTVSPVEEHQKSRLMNELTSPYLLVWSAALASCAVPFLFPPVTLTAKDVDSSYTPYMPMERWVDGSVKSDLPRQRLCHLYDVNFFVVSQVNPHIVPFMESDQKRLERKFMSWPRRALRAQLKFQSAGVLNFLRDRAQTEFTRQALGHAYTIVSQRYYGDVTIGPKRYGMEHYQHVLSNLTREKWAWFRLQGERATWPKIAQIKTHARIAQTLRSCIHKLETGRITSRRVGAKPVLVSGGDTRQIAPG
jgi:NTE family protein